MKRLIFSGLLSLAAVSCGSSDKYKDLKSTFCGGAAVTSSAIKDTGTDAAKQAAAATSCHGDYWNSVADKAACEAKFVEDLELVPFKEDGTKDGSTEVKLSKFTADQLKYANDAAKKLFGKTTTKLDEVCLLGGITPANQD